MTVYPVRRESGKEIPVRIGPVELGRLGKLIAVRCPRELAPLMRQVGDLWSGQSPMAD